MHLFRYCSTCIFLLILFQNLNENNTCMSKYLLDIHFHGKQLYQFILPPFPVGSALMGKNFSHGNKLFSIRTKTDKSCLLRKNDNNPGGIRIHLKFLIYIQLFYHILLTHYYLYTMHVILMSSSHIK